MTNILFCIFIISNIAFAHKPLSVEQAKKLELITSFGKDYLVLQEAQQEKFLLESLSTDNDLLVATSLHYLFKGGYRDVDETVIAGKPISEAIHFMGISSQKIDDFSHKDKVSFWEESLNSSNAYIRIEGAFELIELDSNLALEHLETLEKEGSIISPTANTYRRRLHRFLSMDPPLPIPGNHSAYQQLLSTTKRNVIASTSSREDNKSTQKFFPKLDTGQRNYFQENRQANDSKVELSKKDHFKKNKNKSPNLPWIIAGVLLVGILALLFKVFKGKSTS